MAKDFKTERLGVQRPSVVSTDGNTMTEDEALISRLAELRDAIEALVKAVERDAMRAKEGK